MLPIPWLALTFAYYLVEACALRYLASDAPARCGHVGQALLVAGAAGAAYLLARLRLFDAFQWQQAVLTCAIACAFVLASRRVSLKGALFYAIVFQLCASPVRHLVGHWGIMQTGYNLLIEGDAYPLRAACVAVAGALIFTAFFVLRRIMAHASLGSLSWPQVALMVLATVPSVYLTDLMTSVIRESDAGWARGFGPIAVEAVCCVCGLAVVVGMQRLADLNATRRELDFSRRLIEQQHELYLARRDEAEALGRAHHDLKKHLAALQAAQAPELRAAYLDGLERELSGIEDTLRTGNELLDIIVREQGRRCRARGVDLTVFAGGELLSFLEPMDLTALVGNALDNAVEAASATADGEVILRVAEAAEPYVMVRVENTCDDTATRGGGLDAPSRPRTHKSEPGHGYGLASIDEVARRLGGTASYTQANGRFTLTVLLPRG